MLSLLTPIVKAFLTDNGYQAATMCQQVFGGHGYIKEWGMEQFVRDARRSLMPGWLASRLSIRPLSVAPSASTALAPPVKVRRMVGMRTSMAIFPQFCSDSVET